MCTGGNVKQLEPFVILLVGMLGTAGVLSGCAGKNAVDVDATVQTGIEGTQTAQENLASEVDSAVSATLTAMPTVTPVVVEELSEEELADAVEDSTEEAVQASEQASQAAEEAASDGEITGEELEELYYLYYWTLDEVEQALALADAYYDIYAELLDLTLDELEELEDELEAILATADEVIAALDDISQSLQQGSEIAQQALDNLAQLGRQMAANAQTVREHLPGWKSVREGEFQGLVENALDVLPNDIAETRVGALAQAKEYLQAVQAGIADGRFSLDELTSISQLGANAAASFSNLGGGDLAGLPDMINGLTGNFAHGQLPQVNVNLGSLQNSLPSVR